MTDTPRNKWIALMVLCLGTLMIVLDTTIVNVALPSIKHSLHFSSTSLAWVVNGYLLTFGGLLLLSGRLGDTFGHRRIFLIGLVVFTVASAACGISPSRDFLVAARVIQGFGGAMVSAVSLSLMMTLFTEPAERARAMGFFGFVAAGGGSLGVLLGGLLTGAINWHWIFLVNVPIGIGVYVAALRILPAGGPSTEAKRLDVAGAALVTSALLVAVLGVVGVSRVGWGSPQTLGLLAGAVALLVAFGLVESRTRQPLVPLTLLRLRNLAGANVIGLLWASAMFAWFFLSALYLQLVLHQSPLEVGLAFLPSNLIMGAFSLGLSARLVMRFGIRLPIAVGLGLAGVGLALFIRLPVHGAFLPDVLPSMILLGVGAGMALNPVLLAAMGDVSPEDSGLASGIVNTSFMMGGALGLAVLATLAASRTTALRHAGHASSAALVGGYHLAFAIGAAFAFSAAVLAIVVLRPVDPAVAMEEEMTSEVFEVA